MYKKPTIEAWMQCVGAEIEDGTVFLDGPVAAVCGSRLRCVGGRLSRTF